MDLISIIIPIYGVEDYLDHCVASICAQTYENLEIMGVRAEVKYYFLNNKLIGVQVKFDDNTSMYNKMKEQLTEKLGEGVKPDANALGMAIYLADDDAKLEANSLAWIKDSTMAVLEQDDDDVKVTVVNLSDELTK